MRNRYFYLFIGILLGLGIANFLSGPFFDQRALQSTTNSDLQTALELAPPPAAAQDTATLLADERNTIVVFQEVSPAVVYITTIARGVDLFTLNVFEIPQGTGSGFVWDNQGHIVTNYHVIRSMIAQETSATVTLSDHTTYEAELVGAEASKDLAVLRIEVERDKLKPVPIGSSNNLMVGQKVIAIGNPFGLDQTLTTGVVSALGREIETFGKRTIRDVIQTDAAINPGNSGGPLLDSGGRLIGVNTAIISPSGSSAGIGFAVPVNTVKRVVPQLIQYGKVIRPGLGVQILADSYARSMDITGVVIAEVPRGSAADRAGLRGLQRNWRGNWSLGDIITGINGKKIRNSDDLNNALEQYRVGDVVAVTILRDGKERDIQVQLQQIN